MKIPEEAELVRIFISEDDKWGHKPLYEAIVEEARKHGMAGATVLKGCLGFGAGSRIHSAKVLMLSEELPRVVEIVDGPERIKEFIPVLDGMLKGGGLITLEKIRVITYKSPAEK